MRKLFVSLYVVLVITFVSVGWSLDQIYNRWINENSYTDKTSLYEQILILSSDQLARLDKDQWDSIIAHYQNKFQISMTLEKLDEFEPFKTEKVSLLHGEILTLGDDAQISFHQRIGNHPHVLSLGPFETESTRNSTEILLAIIFYLCLALALFLWFWPLWKNLQTLNKTTIKFGRGDFNTRAVLPRNSSLYNMAETFNNMANRIQHLIKSQKELTNAVSHELRTPISRLRFSMEMIESSKKEISKNKYISEMGTDIDELETLVDEMLTYARLDSQTPQLNFTLECIRPLVEELILKISRQFPNILVQHNLASVSSDAKLEMDKRYFSRALENLLNNAAKYTNSRFHIHVNFNGSSCIIQVEDDGLGIPTDDRNRVFEPFVRLEGSRNRTQGGSGLGLAIVERIVSWHHGDIQIQDSVLGGAGFRLNIPTTQKRWM